MGRVIHEGEEKEKSRGHQEMAFRAQRVDWSLAEMRSEKDLQ